MIVPKNISIQSPNQTSIVQTQPIQQIEVIDNKNIPKETKTEIPIINNKKTNIKQNWEKDIATLVAEQGPATKLATIEYHDTSFMMSDTIKMKTEWFEDQLKSLSDQGYYAVSANDLELFLQGKIQLPAKSVVLTFDLGTGQREDFDKNIIPLLQKYHLRGIFFITTKDIQDQCTGNAHCWSTLNNWKNTGVASFGSHSVSHPDLSKISSTQVMTELVESKRILEEKLGVKINGFAYPFEIYPKDRDIIMSNAGYSFAFAGYSRSIVDLTAKPNDDSPFTLPRLLPYSSDSAYPNLTNRIPENSTTTLIKLVENNSTPVLASGIRIYINSININPDQVQVLKTTQTKTGFIYQIIITNSDGSILNLNINNLGVAIDGGISSAPAPAPSYFTELNNLIIEKISPSGRVSISLSAEGKIFVNRLFDAGVINLDSINPMILLSVLNSKNTKISNLIKNNLENPKIRSLIDNSLKLKDQYQKNLAIIQKYKAPNDTTLLDAVKIITLSNFWRDVESSTSKINLKKELENLYKLKTLSSKFSRNLPQTLKDKLIFETLKSTDYIYDQDSKITYISNINSVYSLIKTLPRNFSLNIEDENINNYLISNGYIKIGNKWHHNSISIQINLLGNKLGSFVNKSITTSINYIFFKTGVANIFEKIWVGIGGRNLASRLELSIMGYRTGAISQQMATQAIANGLRFGVIYIIPTQFGEVGRATYGIYRFTTNFVRNGSMTFTKISQTMSEAKTISEKAKLIGITLASGFSLPILESINPAFYYPLMLIETGTSQFAMVADNARRLYNFGSTSALRSIEAFNSGVSISFAAFGINTFFHNANVVSSNISSNLSSNISSNSSSNISSVVLISEKNNPNPIVNTTVDEFVNTTSTVKEIIPPVKTEIAPDNYDINDLIDDVLLQPKFIGNLNLDDNYIPQKLVNLSDYKIINRDSDVQLQESTIVPLQGFIKDAKVLGYEIGVLQGYRSFTEQKELNIQNPDTAAPAGSSAHQTGYAVDLVITDKDFKTYKDIPKELIPLAEKNGLVHPLGWDSPHFVVVRGISPNLPEIIKEHNLVSTENYGNTSMNAFLNDIFQKITDNPEVIESKNNEEIIYFGNEKFIDTTNKIDQEVIPENIIIHWDGQGGYYNGWDKRNTFNALQTTKISAYTGLSQSLDSHFGVDKNGIDQYLPMYDKTVQFSYAANGYPNTISIEIAGRDFIENGQLNMSTDEFNNVVNLVTTLSDQYGIPVSDIVSHKEFDKLQEIYYLNSQGERINKYYYDENINEGYKINATSIASYIDIDGKSHQVLVAPNPEVKDRVPVSIINIGPILAPGTLNEIDRGKPDVDDKFMDLLIDAVTLKINKTLGTPEKENILVPVLTKAGNLNYFSQADPIWGEVLLPGNDSKLTISEAGCGPTTLAMLLNTYVDNSYNPKNIIEKFLPNISSGSDYSQLKSVLQQFGFIVERKNYNSYNIAKEVADDKIMYLGIEFKTPSGKVITHHTIAFDVDSNGKLIMADPWFGNGATISADGTTITSVTGEVTRITIIGVALITPPDSKITFTKPSSRLER
jgi:peptidoglycan/xylan/chitin deacetylase (PgdA/CDA1 family)